MDNRIKNPTSIRLIRHATLIITINNLKFLVDPMLSPKGSLDPVQNCGNEIRFPMVDLPVSKLELSRLLTETDAVIVTHLHRDHWDVAAQQLIPKDKAIFCQPHEAEKIREQGFHNIIPVDSELEWNGIMINRTAGKHGMGEIGRKMGEVSGFVLQYLDQSIYLAGDTVWCEDVEQALKIFHPKITVLNTGGAKFLVGGPITMTPEDVIRVHNELPATQIIAVHMDTVNHCFVRRTDLAKALSAGADNIPVRIPADGELIDL